MKICAVVVTYNRLSLLKECLDRLLKLDDLDNIIVIDNASDDGTKDYLNSIKSRIFYKRMADNLGGAAGFYQGIKLFMEKTTYDWVWVMDDDTMVNEASLDALEIASKKVGSCGFLASNVRWIDDSPAKMNIPVVDGKKWFESVDSGIEFPRISQASFVSLFISRRAISQVGLPIADFVIWGDDVEFTHRISKEMPCYYVPDSKVVHKMKYNNTTNIVIDEDERIARYFYAYRNGFYNERVQSKRKLIRYIFRSLLDCLRVLKKAKTCKIKRVNTVLRGIIAGVLFNPRVEKVDDNA